MSIQQLVDLCLEQLDVGGRCDHVMTFDGHTWICAAGHTWDATGYVPAEPQPPTPLEIRNHSIREQVSMPGATTELSRRYMRDRAKWMRSQWSRRQRWGR